MDKLGVFHANQTSICLDPQLNYGYGWRSETSLSPAVKVFLLTVPKRCFLWIIFVCVMLSLQPYSLWSPAGKGLTSWLSCM